MSAASEARGIAVGSPVRWKALDIAAFEAHKRVLYELDPRGKYNGGRRRFPPVSLKIIVLSPFILLLYAIAGAPIWGFATLYGDKFGRSNPDPATTIPIAGVIFTIGLPLLVISFVKWLRAGSSKNRARETQATMAMGLGTACTYEAVTRGSAAGVPDWELWVVPIALTGLVGGAFLTSLIRARRANRVAGPKSTAAIDKRPVEPLRGVRLAIERLPAERMKAIRNDVDSAIADLLAREVISVPDANWARGAELGRLAFRMSQSRGQDTAPSRPN